MRPPRAINPIEFKLGNCTGKPFQKDLQKKVVKDALLHLKELVVPGEIVEKIYVEYQNSVE